VVSFYRVTPCRVADARNSAGAIGGPERAAGEALAARPAQRYRRGPRSCYREDSVSQSPLNVHLDKYDGPLDLLLDLIRKQQIDIWDIPIARITAQYLEYLDRAAALDMELSSEFIFMAATLIHIKSRMLLPKDPELEKLSPEQDPRRELVDRLIEHERYKNAAEMLQQKRMIEENVWSSAQIQQFLSDQDEPALAVSLIDLVKTFEQVLERAKTRPVLQVNHDDVSVPDMVLYLTSLLKGKPRGEKVGVAKLFEHQRSRRAMICLFLAMLEMVKMQAIVLVQTDAFGEIALRSHKRFDEVFASDDAMTDIEKDYQ
jgi:segregation and condensation protein A